MSSGSRRLGSAAFCAVAWLMLVSSVAAVAQVDDLPPGSEPDGDGSVVVQSDDALSDPGVDDPGGEDRVLRLGEGALVDGPLDEVWPPPVVSPIVVDDPLPELPVWEGNPEADRPGLVVGVSSVVPDPGEKLAAPPLSALSFEVAEKDAFPDSVRFEVETFKPELAGSVSSFGAGFRVDASVPVGEAKWDSPVEVVLDYEDLPI